LQTRSSASGIEDQALFGSHVRRIGARMGKALAAVAALKGLLSAVDSDVLLEVVLELECFFAVGAFEFAKASALVVTDHVTLQTVDVGEILLAHGTRHLSGG